MTTSSDSGHFATELVAELRGIFDEYQGGVANAIAIKKVSGVLSTIRLKCGVNTYAQEKINSIEYYAKIYFSERKHRSVPGGLSGTLNFIRGDIRNLKSALAREQQ